jgi:hypothetical protein
LYKRLVRPNPAHIRINQQANERKNGDPTYIAHSSEVTISIKAFVVGLNGNRLAGGRSWLFLSFDHPLGCVM